MERYKTLLLDVWREACRHIEIAESVERLGNLLRFKMPLARLIIRRIDAPRSCLETVAVAELGAGDAAATHASDARTACNPAQLETLFHWCRGGRVCGDLDDAPGGSLRFLAPDGAGPHVLAGPLGPPEAPAGVLAIAADGPCFKPEHLALVQLLLEPFSIALENDRRLAEMAALREAAEADKRSLLTRLGRKELGDTVVGAGSGLRGVMDRVELVAPSDVPVLIVGETGTGKELVARLIHNRSPRHAGPFIRVNCGAIPPELIDSQLFGHERGAFTGAVETRHGWFERAHGGTLLLDELGELPLAAQVRLLRILQDGWLERVGGARAIHVDVRIVAATHRDLAAMAAEGKFRDDLWYRIAVFPIVLPPLRERRGDIAELAAHFAGRAATRFGLPLAMPSESDIELLATYPWPGNIRELAAVIDRAAILGNGARLEVAKALGQGEGRGAAGEGQGARAEGPGTGTVPISAPQRPEGPLATPAEMERRTGTVPISAPQWREPLIALAAEMGTVPFGSLDEVIRRHIETALAATHGRIEGPRGAAALLRINPHTLRARMRKLGIDWKRFRPPSATQGLGP